ncbi:MAG: chaperone NapD [Planctomycetaceae bacterium]|nr:chaperone NapD [Planctomycetaceae bacterium]
MNVSSLVITIVDNALESRIAEDALADIPCLEVGQKHGYKIPVVLETKDESDARDWFHQISQLPGVLKVEVAFVSFEDLDPVEY